MKQENKATELLEKAVKLNPSMVTTITENKHLHAILPERTGSFQTLINSIGHERPVELAKKPTQHPFSATDHSRKIKIQSPTSLNKADRLSNLSFSFEDSSLQAHIQIDDNNLRLRYNIKKSDISVPYVDTTHVIKPIRNNKTGLNKTLNSFKTVLFCILIAAFIGFVIGKLN
jgi:hypothetical protein